MATRSFQVDRVGGPSAGELGSQWWNTNLAQVEINNAGEAYLRAGKVYCQCWSGELPWLESWLVAGLSDLCCLGW